MRALFLMLLITGVISGSLHEPGGHALDISCIMQPQINVTSDMHPVSTTGKTLSAVPGHKRLRYRLLCRLRLTAARWRKQCE